MSNEYIATLQISFFVLNQLIAKQGHRSFATTNEQASEATQTLRAGCIKADPQTNKHRNRGDYNTLRSLFRSVIN